MRHYVILFRPSVIGPNTWLTSEFVAKHEKENETPEFTYNEFGTIESTEESLLRSQFEKVSMVKADARTLIGTPYTLQEFVMGKCGALTVFWFDESGNFTHRDVWSYDRTMRKVNHA